MYIICGTCFCLEFCMNRRDGKLFLHKGGKLGALLQHSFFKYFNDVGVKTGHLCHITVSWAFSFQVWWAFFVCECTDFIYCYCFNQESLAVSSSCTHVKLLGVVCHVKPERPPCNICIKPCCSFITHIVRVFSCGKCCRLFWPRMSSFPSSTC